MYKYLNIYYGRYVFSVFNLQIKWQKTNSMRSCLTYWLWWHIQRMYLSQSRKCNLGKKFRQHQLFILFHCFCKSLFLSFLAWTNIYIVFPDCIVEKNNGIINRQYFHKVFRLSRDTIGNVGDYLSYRLLYHMHGMMWCIFLPIFIDLMFCLNTFHVM